MICESLLDTKTNHPCDNSWFTCRFTGSCGSRRCSCGYGCWLLITFLNSWLWILGSLVEALGHRQAQNRDNVGEGGHEHIVVRHKGLTILNWGQAPGSHWSLTQAHSPSHHAAPCPCVNHYCGHGVNCRHGLHFWHSLKWCFFFGRHSVTQTMGQAAQLSASWFPQSTDVSEI